MLSLSLGVSILIYRSSAAANPLKDIRMMESMNVFINILSQVVHTLQVSLRVHGEFRVCTTKPAVFSSAFIFGSMHLT